MLKKRDAEEEEKAEKKAALSLFVHESSTSVHAGER